MSEFRDYYVSPDAVVEGPVSFSTGCVVMAHARVVAPDADTPLRFGTYCLIEEYAQVIAATADGERASGAPSPLSVGSCNHFKVRCRVEGFRRIGTGNIFHPSSRVVHADTIGDNCVFTPFVVVEGDSGRPSSPASTAPSLTSTVVGRPMLLPSGVTVMEADGGWAAVPRFGSRSVAELPSMAQALLTSTDPSGGLAVAPDDSDNESHSETEEGSPAAGSDGGAADSGESAATTDSGTDEGEDAGATPAVPRLPLAQMMMQTTPQQRRKEEEEAGAGQPTGAAVQAMLDALPRQIERDTAQGIVGKCRYYLTLHGVL